MQMGHDRIGIWVEGKNSDHLGYVKAHVEAGFRVDPGYILETKSPEGAAEHLAGLSEPPTALVVAKRLDQSVGLMQALRGRGIQPGRDLYLCSYDHSMNNTPNPDGAPSARIERPVERIASEAARVLGARVEGVQTGPTHTLLPSTLVADAP